ncbi:serine/threonine-protein kinase [Streptomyces sp. DSM 44917]|uniref:Serine/threonine-protein kinase n=1 Tax=Streptomyces boetiae TaxID=3075541 RepID=A0ABU2LC11_9ACTN|nr:serine/threonine-protein kinase [Streptomyces sp. DSM 44917]MDT0309124.1 serine/threonine-protein kinase [Streptomyces sp. DSM 44917]
MTEALAALSGDDPQTVGPYRVLRRLGRGGMGRVYLARSAGGRTVALKVVHRHFAADERFRARFAREVTAARAVGGAWTAPVLDADPAAEIPWVATGYVAGPDLHAAVRAHGPLPERTLRALGAGLAEALATVHARGLVHRDVKPSNVLLALEGPRLIDFGIARATDATAQLTATGVAVGSPGYMSPEQVVGGEVGPATDVFAFGAVMAFAAGGSAPFPGDTPAQLLYQVVHEQPRLDEVPGWLRELVAACLEKDPARRPAPAHLTATCGDAPSLVTPGWLPQPIVEEATRHAITLLNLEAAPLPAPTTEPAAGSPDAPPVQGPAAGWPAAAAPTEARATGSQPGIPPGTAQAPAGAGAPGSPPGAAPGDAQVPVPGSPLAHAQTGAFSPWPGPQTPPPGAAQASGSWPGGAQAGPSGGAGVTDPRLGMAVPAGGSHAYGADTVGETAAGARTVPSVARRRRWRTVAAAVVAVASLGVGGAWLVGAFDGEGGEPTPNPTGGDTGGSGGESGGGDGRLPQAFAGEWEGTMEPIPGLNGGTIAVVLADGATGEELGTVTTVDAMGLSTCVDRLTLQETGESQVVLRAEHDPEASTGGRPFCTEGTHEAVLRLDENGVLSYDPTGDGAPGRLTRSGGGGG